MISTGRQELSATRGKFQLLGVDIKWAYHDLVYTENNLTCTKNNVFLRSQQAGHCQKYRGKQDAIMISPEKWSGMSYTNVARANIIDCSALTRE